MAGIAALSGCTSASPVPSPSLTERPTFSGTRIEHARAMADCMRSKGVNARFVVDGEGAPTVEVDDDARPTSKEEDPGPAASRACAAELPVRPEPRTDADFKVMHDNLIVQTKCVQREGYETPPVPSWQSFLEDARAQDVDWEPTIRVPQQLRSSVRKACVDQDKWW